MSARDRLPALRRRRRVRTAVGLPALPARGRRRDAAATARRRRALPRLGTDTLVLEAELGRGGMGRVFRARDERLGRAVAVKVLRPESAANPDFRARFAREARTLARLEHPGIVAVHDFGTTPDGDGYLVMQLVSGGSIADRLPLPVADALAIAVELCARARVRARPRHHPPRHQAGERADRRRRPGAASATSASRAWSTRRPKTAR